MLLNDDFLFLHYPKTAGKSLTTYFLNVWERPIRGTVSPGQPTGDGEGLHLDVGNAHQSMPYAATLLKEQDKSIHDLKAVFVGIRNPYDMAVSTYFFLRNSVEHHDDRARFRRALNMSFEEFWCTEPITAPPERWLTLRGKEIQNLRVIRFESLGQDLAAIAAEFGFRQTELPHLNRTDHRHYREYITPEVEEAVFARYRYLFEAGHYPRQRVRRSWRRVLRQPGSLLRRLRPLPAPDLREDITADLEAKIASSASKGQVTIPPGEFTISRTIRLPSNATLKGAGAGATRLFLKPRTDAPMFANGDPANGNRNIRLEGLSLCGNARQQQRDEGKATSRALVDFVRVDDAELTDIAVRDAMQSGLLFVRCNDTALRAIDCERIEWSGVYAIACNRMAVKNSRFRAIGTTVRQAAVQLNGGIGADIDCEAEVCSTGVLLTSRHSDLESVVVRARCNHCRQGIALVGDTQRRLHNVLLKECKVADADVGIRVSNSANVFVNDCEVRDAWATGLLLEGRHGAKFVVVTGARFERNATDVQEIHASENNHFHANHHDGGTPFVPKRPSVGVKARPADSYTGRCTLCGKHSVFEHNGGSLRESYRCEHCRASLRYRGQAKAILDAWGNGCPVDQRAGEIRRTCRARHL